MNHEFVCRGRAPGMKFPVLELRTDHVIADISVSIARVYNVLSSLDPSKSIGPDGIAPRVLKNCCDSLCVPLSMLFAQSMESGSIPNEWKSGLVTPIYKNKGSRSDPKNYRPITITSAVGKVFEHIINSDLVDYLLKHGLISDSQFGFLPNHSCTDQLVYLNHKCMSQLSDKRLVASVFLDLAAAFDSVPHAAIKCKLHAYGIRGKLYRWICNYLNNRCQRVKLDGHLSKYARVVSGVPQGGVIAPILFLLFINDLSDEISQCMRNVETTASGSHLLYADDSMLLCYAKTELDMIAYLNTQLFVVSRWAEAWGMSYNPNKTVAMYFCRTPVSNCPLKDRIFFMDQPIKFVNEHRHLGFTIRSDLGFNSHIDSICKAVASRIFLLKRLSYYVQVEDILLRIYKSYILPLFEYASPAWSALNVTQTERLEKLQRRAMRIICGLPYTFPVSDCHYAHLSLQPLMTRRSFALCCYGYKLINSLLPRRLAEVKPVLHVFPVRTRRGRLIVPGIKYPTQRNLDRSPVLYLTKLLNFIPNLWSVANLEAFKSELWNTIDRNVFVIAF